MQHWHSQFWSLHIDSLTVRLLYLIAPKFVPNLMEISNLHRIDLQHEDDHVEVHLLTGSQLLDCECPSASSLL